MFRKILHIIALIAILPAFSGCVDEFPDQYRELGDGEASISATVAFEPLSGSEMAVGRSAAGNSIKNITSLSVFIYDKNQDLTGIYSYDSENPDAATITNIDIKQDGNTQRPDDGHASAEKATPRATFTIGKIPYGHYYMYVVANIPEFTDTEENRTRFSTPDKLKSYSATWDSDDIAANNQMFGYFATEDGTSMSANGEDADVRYEAPLITVGKPQMKLHAWARRLASKVTVVYDGSGLLEDIEIYIRSITIKDIPLNCPIGKDNEPGKDSQFIATGDSITYGKDGELQSGETPSDDYRNWMMIAQYTPVKGSVAIGSDGGTVSHSENAQAMYFFENMQGNYPEEKKYDKRPDLNETGWIPTKPTDNGFKDNIPYGTYIEVDAYYISNNAKQLSRGPIKYRFMLGQDCEYNYNAERNCHYKLTLGFKGFANQPDWHIVYKENQEILFVDASYYISYGYNHRAEFPVRLGKGIKEFEVEIVENNWAPYDPTSTDSVPEQSIPAESVSKYAIDFNWNRPVYMNEGNRDKHLADNYTATPGEGNIPPNGYYYGLQQPYDKSGGTSITEYPHTSTDQVKYIGMTPPKYVTPIWAGFLTVNNPDMDNAFLLNGTVNGKKIEYAENYNMLKDHFYNKDKPQNYRTFSEEDLSFPAWNKDNPARMEKKVGTGNLETKVVKGADGSVTVHLPMFTRPKTMLGISGFTGNNPYDTYQRKAVVKLTATYSNGKKIVSYNPVYQCRRIVNPKAVWRKHNDPEPFHVQLLRRNGAAANEFSTFTSQGKWRAYVRLGDKGFKVGTNDTIHGDDGTPIDFNISFPSVTEGSTKCAVIRVEYHGYTSSHDIFVRKGYKAPLALVDGGAKWSSFSLYSCENGIPFKSNWNGSNYVKATITASPLTLGTFFKRGNYNGILNSNNSTADLERGEAPGDTGMKMTWGESLPWNQINGMGVRDGSSGVVAYNYEKFEWRHFETEIEIEGKRQTRRYRVPSLDDYNALTACEYGVGVLYADGADGTKSNIDDAYGFTDYANNNNNNAGIAKGMRGVIVYNKTDGRQIFFSIGTYGMGRRTNQGAATGSFGTLRYGSVNGLLTQAYHKNNQFRPIPYNMANVPGAVYWVSPNEATNGTYEFYPSWDMNYFDLNFNPYDYACLNGMGSPDSGQNYGGDACPIKLILDE